MKNPLLVIISSPSGGGKDSVINALIKRLPRATRLVTTTTRPPRPGNQEGVDYYFISEKTFESKLAAGDFLEHNVYAGNYYGEEKKELERRFKNYDIVFSQIDVTGKHALDKLGVPHLSVFLAPENLGILRARIKKRGGITPGIIAERLAIAKREIKESADYDYRIVNVDGKLEQTIKKIAKIITARLREPTRLDKKRRIS